MISTFLDIPKVDTLLVIKLAAAVAYLEFSVVVAFVNSEEQSVFRTIYFLLAFTFGKDPIISIVTNIGGYSSRSRDNIRCIYGLLLLNL